MNNFNIKDLFRLIALLGVWAVAGILWNRLLTVAAATPSIQAGCGGISLISMLLVGVVSIIIVFEGWYQ
jgi:hypothetical protein